MALMTTVPADASDFTSFNMTSPVDFWSTGIGAGVYENHLGWSLKCAH